jgi:hypothetical protein
VLNGAAILLRPRALARVGLVGDDQLVHEGLVELAAEDGLRRGHRRGGLALGVQDLQLHRAS